MRGKFTELSEELIKGVLKEIFKCWLVRNIEEVTFVIEVGENMGRIRITGVAENNG